LIFEQADAVGEPQVPRANEPRLDHFDLVDQLSDFDVIGHWLSVLWPQQAQDLSD